jgi:hypothetical protein
VGGGLKNVQNTYSERDAQKWHLATACLPRIAEQSQAAIEEQKHVPLPYPDLLLPPIKWQLKHREVICFSGPLSKWRAKGYKLLLGDQCNDQHFHSVTHLLSIYP